MLKPCCPVLKGSLFSSLSTLFLWKLLGCTARGAAPDSKQSVFPPLAKPRLREQVYTNIDIGHKV